MKSNELKSLSCKLFRDLSEMHLKKYCELVGKSGLENTRCPEWLDMKLEKIWDIGCAKKIAIIGAEDTRARKKYIYRQNARKKKHP